MLTDEMKAQGWVEVSGSLPVGRCDLLFSTGEVSRMCNTALASVAIGADHIIAYKPEQPNG